MNNTSDNIYTQISLHLKKSYPFLTGLSIIIFATFFKKCKDKNNNLIFDNTLPLLLYGFSIIFIIYGITNYV